MRRVIKRPVVIVSTERTSSSGTKSRDEGIRVMKMNNTTSSTEIAMALKRRWSSAVAWVGRRRSYRP